MILYLARHAEAAPVDAGIQRDSDRPLTPRGEEDARTLGGTLLKLRADIGLIVTSPLVRAVQTAEEISRQLPNGPEVRRWDILAPGFRPRQLFNDLFALGESAQCLVVGHQPDLGMLLAYLLDVPVHGCVALPPGGAAKIIIGSGNPPADAHLEWLLTPQLMRALAV